VSAHRERLVHHELCFGCGRTNLFGLLMELERAGEGLVTGRGFVKQDHQGPLAGTAHDGIVAAALSEAMSFVSGSEMRATWLEVRIHGPVPVGAFIEVQARVLDYPDGGFQASATATVEDQPVASARGSYERR
jgi:acyl-coenzyme A thioesterase PaaI-like protein